MSTLISAANLMTLTDAEAATFAAFLSSLDAAQTAAIAEVATLASVFASDPVQYGAWLPAYLKQYSGASNGNGAVSGAFALAGFGGSAFQGGGFGGGNGLLSRGPALYALWGPKLTAIKGLLKAYGAPTVTDFNSFAAAANAATAYSCLFHPNFAALFFYAMNQALQLAPGAVFVPGGTRIGTATITAANAASLTNAVFPILNGASAAGQITPGTDANGNLQYFGSLPCPQGFAPVKGIVAHGAVLVNGTCVVTLTGKNQANAVATWAATVTSLAVGSEIAFAPANAGDRLYGAPTAIAVSGSATAGAFSILAVAER